MSFAIHLQVAIRMNRTSGDSLRPSLLKRPTQQSTRPKKGIADFAWFQADSPEDVKVIWESKRCKLEGKCMRPTDRRSTVKLLHDSASARLPSECQWRGKIRRGKLKFKAELIMIRLAAAASCTSYTQQNCNNLEQIIAISRLEQSFEHPKEGVTERNRSMIKCSIQYGSHQQIPISSVFHRSKMPIGCVEGCACSNSYAWRAAFWIDIKSWAYMASVEKYTYEVKIKRVSLCANSELQDVTWSKIWVLTGLTRMTIKFVIETPSSGLERCKCQVRK